VAANAYGVSDPSGEASDAVIDIPLSPSGLLAVGDSSAGTVALTWTLNHAAPFCINRRIRPASPCLPLSPVPPVV